MRAGEPRGEPPLFAQDLFRWYDKHARPLPWRLRPSPYAIWVAEVLLQQTRVAQAVPYYRRFLRAFPTVRALARAPLSRVLKVWEGAGYYARARNLHRAARDVVRRWGGRLPSSVSDLETLPGIGEYMARAIASQAFEIPVLGLDANVLRVAARYYGERRDPARAPVRQGLKDRLEQDLPAVHPGRSAQAIMELGETVCLPRSPRCTVCPIAPHCWAYRELPDPGVLPRRHARASRRCVPMAVLVLENKGRVLVHQRPPEGLLGGLWEFPEIPVGAGGSPAAAARRAFRRWSPRSTGELRAVGTFRYGYTHFVCEITVFHATVGAQSEHPRGHRWVPRSDLGRLPMAGAARRAWDHVLGSRDDRAPAER